MNTKLLLTISILISNRPDTVRKCLDSIKPLLEQIPSELILVDTGCGEQVRKIIEEYTDQIIEFEWCRDFSKARNAGLEKAKGEWFLFLDDDEWFEDVTEIIDFFNSGEYKGYGMAAYTQRNYLERDGSVYTDLLVARMTKLAPDTRFIYRIHEYFNHVRGNTKKFNTFVHHYGYIYDSVKESRAHSMRNISLLLEEHEADPGNMKHTLQLVQEYNIINEYSKSLELSLEAIRLAEMGKINNEYFLSSIYANEIGCYMNLYRYDEAILKGEQYLTHPKTDKMVRDLIAGNLTAAYMDREDYGKVLKYARYYWEGYRDYLENEESFLAFVTNITGMCFEDHNRSVVLGRGIRAAAMLGEGDQAWQWFDSFDWKTPQIFVSEEMIRTVVERIPESDAEERHLYVKMCNVLLGREELEGCLLRAITECCRSRKSLEERINALASYEGVLSEHWFFKLRKLVMEADGDASGLSAAEAERLAGEIWENVNLCMPSVRTYAMMDAVECLGGNNRKILEAVPFYLWKNGITMYFEQFSWEDADWWNGRFSAVLQREDVHMLVWRGLYGLSGAVRASGELEKDKAKAAGDGKERADFDRIREGLQEYSACYMTLCEKMYRPEIISEARDMFPEEYQGAYLIADLLEQTEGREYSQAVETIKKIKKLTPGLTNVLKPYLQWIDEELKRQKQESRQAAGEFQVLARQIKMKLWVFMDAGQNEAALAVARQLQALLPEDEEIQQIVEKLG